MLLCNNCPRKCGAVRTPDTNIGGICASPELPKIARAGLHFWEEPCISGQNGSGTVFFSGCSLGCVYCQNYSISHENYGKIISYERLAEIFKELEDLGAHNINLVNPTHYFHAIEKAFDIYRPKVPIVYNSGGYDLCQNINKNLFDIYLFDFKYFNNETALRYSKAENYVDVVKEAILSAYSLIPEPIYEDNIMKKGVIIRHLILPQHTEESKDIILWCAKNVPNAVISIMSQYIPMYKAENYKEINRTITKREYEKVLDYIIDLNLENIIVQERSSADNKFIPKFDLTGI